MTTTVAFLDTNVLFSTRVTDVLLHAALRKLYEPRWSERVLDALVRYIPQQRPYVTTADITRRVDQMRKAFPYAMVSGFEHLEPTMRNHPGDRHVLAAAVHGRADVLVTDNLKDFPEAEMARHGIELMHHDVFLCDLFDDDEETMLDVVETCVRKRRRPPEEFGYFLDGLAKARVPKFAAHIRELSGPVHLPGLQLPQPKEPT